MLHRNRARRSAIALTTAGLIGTSLLLTPAAFGADGAGAPGGATRNPDDKISLIRDSIVDGPAKNVILLIGDGMGDSEITIARNYAYGAGGMLPGIDALPLTGSYTTYSLDEDGKVDYVPDSAATGTAWATGTKTYDGAIAVDIDGRPHATLLELAKANRKKTGNVSTAEIQDATPAVQAAHVASRKCYGPTSAACGPDALEAGGLGSISEQILDTRADLTLGGGAASFTQQADAGQWTGRTLFEQAGDRGYQVLRTPADLEAVRVADQTAPVLGTFTDGNFPTRYTATTATVGGADAAPVTCSENPERLPASLSLAALTERSIGLLDTGDSGFFLQVEGASIDKQDHAADACGQIGETLDLDEAVQAALDFAERDGDTLVIVTADHAHSSQLVDGAPPAALSIALNTNEGSVMRVSYGTAAAGQSQQHTGAQVRIAAYGPGAASVVGLTDQTDTFFTVANGLELNRDVAALSAGAVLDAPAKVAPGGTVTATVRGLYGDRQVSGALTANAAAATAAAPTSIGRTDVIDGGATFTLTAPSEPGTYVLTLAGEQTATAPSASITVEAGAPTSPSQTATPSDSASPSISASETTGAGSGVPPHAGGSLPITGGTVAGGLLLVAAALVGAGVLVRSRRAHGHV